MFFYLIPLQIKIAFFSRYSQKFSKNFIFSSLLFFKGSFISQTNAVSSCYSGGTDTSGITTSITIKTCVSPDTYACGVGFILDQIFFKLLKRDVKMTISKFYIFIKKAVTSTTVYKLCTSSCTEGTDTYGRRIYCCFSDNCNGASSLTFSSSMWPLTLGALINLIFFL